MVTTATQPEQMLTIDDVAAALKFSRSKTKQLIYAGQIVSTKVGRHRRVRASDLAAYMQGLPAAVTNEDAAA